MAAITEDFDIKIRVVFPYLTKSLPKDDSDTITATGNFNFEPPPQVETPIGATTTSSPIKGINPSARADTLKSNLNSLAADFDNIQEAFRKRAKHIALKYDPELAQNESLANAEISIFGFASGEITYEMFDLVIDYENKIDKYISHMSIENEGVLSGVA